MTCCVLFLKSGVTLRSMNRSWLKPCLRNAIRVSSHVKLESSQESPSRTGHPPNCVSRDESGTFPDFSISAVVREKLENEGKKKDKKKRTGKKGRERREGKKRWIIKLEGNLLRDLQILRKLQVLRKWKSKGWRIKVKVLNCKTYSNSCKIYTCSSSWWSIQVLPLQVLFQSIPYEIIIISNLQV